MTVEISTNNLDAEIERYTKDLGYRLDMIVPADAPREALVSKGGERVRLVVSSEFRVPSFGLKTNSELGTRNSELWITGRAGMEYRDLIPDRLGGKVIASHIRLTAGGEVPDYVHYHKIDFQMIYCKRGRIRVVYEDQGPPFWLETGDCVLQPPEIRHRVLECTAGAEVIEVSMPAEHETWVEHDITLPTSELNPERIFGGQRFVRILAAESEWTEMPVGGLSMCETEFEKAPGGAAGFRRFRPTLSDDLPRSLGGMYAGRSLYVVLSGNLTIRQGESVLAKDETEDIAIQCGDAFIIPSLTLYDFDCSPDVELLQISLL